MLRFDAYTNDAPATQIDLEGAYAFGQDGIPMRADLGFADGALTLNKRTPGAAGVSLMYTAGSAGRYMLPTTRLPERNKPYNLNIELARSQMNRIFRKREDWGLFDYPEAASLNDEFRAVMGLFIESLKQTDPVRAAQLAAQSLAAGLTLGERFSLFHADIFLDRRKTLGGLRPGFGCAVDLFSTSEAYTDRLREPFDFVSIPIPWKLTEPKEHTYNWGQVDAWINWAASAGKAIHAGPLISMDPGHLPEWLYIWEHDFDALRDLVYERVERVVRRYKDQALLWTAISGIHAQNSFNMNFEQLMELTRNACLMVKKIAPRAQIMIEVVLPWGEYYARNQRTIPPMLYADMAVQSGVKFDSFGVRILMGRNDDGFYVRDLLQISAMLDEFVGFGKPLHITACQVPSAVDAKVEPAGRWHAPWSPRLQAEWLQAFYRVALSKPFVESVSWADLADYPDQPIPGGGICGANLKPKLAYKELRNFRSAISNAWVTAPAGSAPAIETDLP